VSPENRAKYRAQVQVSYGIYLDAYANPPTSPWFVDGLGGSRVARLQTNVADALRCADEYVWIYGEKSSWWPGARSDISTPWEEKLPGVTSALSFAADPDGYGRRRVQELWEAGKCVELARNGDFQGEKTTNPAGGEAVYKEGGAPAGWGTWEAATGGRFTWDRGVGRKAAGSARAAKVGNGCFIQEISPVKPGERYLVAGSYKLQGQGTAQIRVRWQTADGKWIHDQLDRMIYGRGKAGEWVDISGVAQVPEGVGRLVILLGMGGQMADTDVIWYDDVHCHPID
jgi:hypothetical protein